VVAVYTEEAKQVTGDMGNIIPKFSFFPFFPTYSQFVKHRFKYKLAWSTDISF